MLVGRQAERRDQLIVQSEQNFVRRAGRNRDPAIDRLCPISIAFAAVPSAKSSNRGFTNAASKSLSGTAITTPSRGRRFSRSGAVR